MGTLTPQRNPAYNMLENLSLKPVDPFPVLGYYLTLRTLQETHEQHWIHWTSYKQRALTRCVFPNLQTREEETESLLCKKGIPAIHRTLPYTNASMKARRVLIIAAAACGTA